MTEVESAVRGVLCMVMDEGVTVKVHQKLCMLVGVTFGAETQVEYEDFWKVSNVVGDVTQRCHLGLDTRNRLSMWLGELRDQRS